MNGYTEYEPTDLDDELFLSEVPLAIIKKSIETQFDEPLENRKRDFVQTFITKYEFSLNEGYEEEMNDLSMLHDNFLSFMVSIFDKYLDVGIEDLDELGEEAQHELIHLTYRFFIKNIKKNFVTLILNYIEGHKQELIEDLPRKKDLTTINFKNEIDNESDVVLLSNMNTVIKNILNEEFDVDEFFELCTSDEFIIELEFVKSKFNAFVLTGNFVPKYISMIDSDFKQEIESKVRSNILKRYPKRSKEEKKVSEPLDK